MSCVLLLRRLKLVGKRTLTLAVAAPDKLGGRAKRKREERRERKRGRESQRREKRERERGGRGSKERERETRKRAETREMEGPFTPACASGR